jgi:hypothetical protein
MTTPIRWLLVAAYIALAFAGAAFVDWLHR